MRTDTRKELTPERSRIIADTYAEWKAVGLSIEPANFDAAETAIVRMYERIGKKRPYFVRLSSPLAAELYIDLYCRAFGGGQLFGQLFNQLSGQLFNQLFDQLGGHLGGQLFDQLRDQLRDQLGGQLSDQLSDHLRDQLRDQLFGRLRDHLGGRLRGHLGGQLRDQLGGQLRDQLRDHLRGQLFVQLFDQLFDQLRVQLRGHLGGQLRDQLSDQLGGQLSDQLRDHLGGQLGDQLGGQLGGDKIRYMGTWFWGSQDYSWMWIDGGRRVGAIYSAATNAALDDHCIVSRSIGWWYPFDDFVIMTDRPDRIVFDDNNRLHSETGPALHYRDGYGLSAWHGTVVPCAWIENRDTVDPSEIIRHENVEVRAAGAAIVGWPRMLSVLDARVIHDSGSPDIGQLIELKLPGLDEPGRFLKATCPRNGIICEGVPRVSDIDGLPIETALAAQAWRIGDPLSDYIHPPART